MPSIWLIWGFIKTHFISKHSLMQERSVQSQAVLFLLYHVFCKDNSNISSQRMISVSLTSGWWDYSAFTSLFLQYFYEILGTVNID